MVVVSRREARTMGADEDRDRERHAEGAPTTAPSTKPPTRKQAFPGWGTTVTATAIPGAVPTSATCMKPSKRKRSARSRSVSGPLH
jgi:hypothetical protein